LILVYTLRLTYHMHTFIHTAGLLLAVWDFPFIYTCVPSFDTIQNFLLEKLHLKLDIAKSVLYNSLSVLFFLYPTLCIIPGICLLVSGVLFAFAAYNKHVDNQDGTSSLSGNSEESPYEPQVLYTHMTYVHVCIYSKLNIIIFKTIL
jgi:hypothetical protein